MAGVVIWCPSLFFSRFLHALAGPGHPLRRLADVGDDSGWFSLVHKGQGQQPSYLKTQYKPNLSQLGPWPLKGHLSMRALAVGRCEQLGLPSGVLVLGVRGGQGPSGLPLGVQWGPLGGRQGDITLAVRRPPPPPGAHTAREISQAMRWPKRGRRIRRARVSPPSTAVGSRAAHGWSGCRAVVQ